MSRVLSASVPKELTFLCECTDLIRKWHFANNGRETQNNPSFFTKDKDSICSSPTIFRSLFERFPPRLCETKWSEVF